MLSCTSVVMENEEDSSSNLRKRDIGHGLSVLKKRDIGHGLSFLSKRDIGHGLRFLDDSGDSEESIVKRSKYFPA
jgi:hypothetical protein